jgi:hypothetical protein
MTLLVLHSEYPCTVYEEYFITLFYQCYNTDFTSRTQYKQRLQYILLMLSHYNRQAIAEHNRQYIDILFLFCLFLEGFCILI